MTSAATYTRTHTRTHTPHALRARWLLTLCAALVALMAVSSAFTVVSPVQAQEQAPLPKFAKARIGTDRWGARIRAKAFGPDDAVVLAYDNGYVRRWDLATQHLVWEVRLGTQPLPSVAFAGAKALVISAEDGTTTLLNADSGEVAKSMKLDWCNKACELQASYASDKILLTVGVIKDPDTSSSQNTLRLWSLSDGKLLQTHVVTNVSTAAISPDGAHVVWTTFDQPEPAQVYLASAASLSSPKAVACPININNWEPTGQAIIFSPDSQAVIFTGKNSTTEDLTVCVISAAKATALHTVNVVANPDEGYMNRLRAAVFSTDSKWLQVAYDEGSYGRDDFYVNSSPVIAINLTAGTQSPLYDLPEGIAWTYNHSAAPFSSSGGDTIPVAGEYISAELNISPSGSRGATATAIPQKWMIANAHTGAVNQLAASPNGAEVFSVDIYGHALRWRLDSGATASLSLLINGQLLYTPDGLSLLEAHPAVLRDSNGECSTDPRMGSIGLWRLSDMTRAPLHRDPKLMTRAARWLPDGRLLTCREQHDANESDCGTPRGPIHSYFEAISPNGQKVEPFKASLTMCPTAEGVSVATSRAITFYNADLESGSGASGYDPGRARVQDLTTGDVLLTLPENVPVAAALSPDGKWVAYINDSNGTQPLSVHVFSVDAKAEAFSIPLTVKPTWYYGSPVALFSADNQLVFSDAAALRVANPTLGADAPAKSLTIPGHAASISAATFSADGKTLFTAQYDGLIYAWDWPAITAL